MNNDTVTDLIWDIISNTEVLAVNQAYAGDSGGVYDTSMDRVELTDAYIEANDDEARVQTPSHQYLAKNIGGGKVAVLLMNSGNGTATLTADFSKVPNSPCTDATHFCHVRDIWNHKDLGTFQGTWSGPVDSHDAAFLVLSNTP